MLGANLVFVLMPKTCGSPRYVTVIATQKLEERQSKVDKLFPVGCFGSIGCDSPRRTSNNDYYFMVRHPTGNNLPELRGPDHRNFRSASRRNDRRIVNDVTVIATQKLDENL
uniref:Uncharacterized protein n=1 Tax=Candidatus Kentrum sp. FM TaxID=2126340 RepID=A0A450T668_9GAMM|nr:MAG: hypothetical protein BECKFM1743A_GA0114220_102065 [Candidatus Kentron sp. FM]VFJ62239.1 MAG: hypothetical protein BECKFM1743C_GA0114222_103124 [Candidatus Kentron sp. FM]VFK14195.1 MAG: hypothetical protein BECKFM1743B_GA0114221_103113 [Candidatus Kentron sp. FM]